MSCNCKTKKGTSCKLKIKRGQHSFYCWIHRSPVEYRRFGGKSKRGGRGCLPERKIVQLDEDELEDELEDEVEYETKLDTQLETLNDAESELSKHINWLLRKWRKDLKSGGSNNSTTYSGLKKVFDSMHLVRPFTAQSVFVDMGSGAGIPCIYIAMRFGCKVYGIEYDSDLVNIAKKYARESGVENLCFFEAKDFSTMRPVWFENRQVTHTFAFDGVYSPEVWDSLFYLYNDVPQRLVGASVSKFKRFWPGNIKGVGKPLSGIKLSGGKSSFNFHVWEKKRN